MVCLVHCRQELHKSLEKLQNIFFKTETKTKTKYSRPRPRLHDPRLAQTKTFILSSRRLETKTMVSRTTSLKTVRFGDKVTREH